MTLKKKITINTSNNQRLRSAGDNDRKVKTLLLQRCALRKFHVTDGQNTRDTITSDRRSRRAYARDRIAFCAFHSFLVEVQTHTGYIHTTNAK